MDLISVIVPVYNVEKFLFRCVESIRNQSYKNLEIILVDDGSPDNCPKMCDDLIGADCRIKVIHKQNEGLGLTRNAGLEIAIGEYVTFIDSDDWISETHIETLYKAIVENNADAVIGTHTIAFANGKRVPRSLSLKEQVYEKDEVINKIVLPLIGADLNHQSDVQIDSSCCMNLYKTDIIRKHNLKFISERYAIAEDLYFNIDFFNHSIRVVAVNETGYFYFENTESISRKYNRERFGRTLNYYNELNSQIKKYGLESKVGHRINRSFIMKIRFAIRHIVMSDLKQKEKICEIKGILENEVTKKVLACYPINYYVPLMRFLVKLMKSENVYGVYYLIKFRESIKKTQFLKDIFKLFGIGK